MGVETGNDAIMKTMKKGVNKAKILDAADVLREVGLPFSSTFIIGHPNETMASIIDTMRFAHELNPTRPAFGIMVPYPGTLVYELATRGEGGYRKMSANWEDYNKHFGNAVELEGLPRRTLEIMKLFAYLFVYFWSPAVEKLIDRIADGVDDERKIELLETQLEVIKGDVVSVKYENEHVDVNKRKAILTFMSREFHDLDRIRQYTSAPDRPIPPLLRDELIFFDSSWKTEG